MTTHQISVARQGFLNWLHAVTAVAVLVYLYMATYDAGYEDGFVDRGISYVVSSDVDCSLVEQPELMALCVALKEAR